MHDTSSNEPIRFYSTGDAFGEFSNFAAFPVKIGGKTWPTTEHYFQAQKFQDAGHVEKIRKSGSPMTAARLGRDRKAPLRKDWEAVKIAVMRLALLAKFTQHAEPRELLLSTGERRLIESTPNDDYWGDDGAGSGKNMLAGCSWKSGPSCARRRQGKTLPLHVSYLRAAYPHLP